MKNIMDCKIWLIISTLLFVSCEKKNNDKNENLIQFTTSKDTSFNSIKSHKINKDLFTLKELSISDLNIKADKSLNINEKVFEFEIEYNNETSQNNRNIPEEKLVEYLSFKIENDFKLIIKDTEFNPSGVMYEREYKLRNKYKFLIFFDNVSDLRDAVLQYDDKIFNYGIINFKVL